ncbi:uncharacterized protein [Sagmatias obliquidens]|uniref:uncharacterized protein n=1 Tax=Sagmatias obliquidens TaxID=3371155 RepID=UPI000F4447EF|nr:uncharacterized protein LOC113625973 [Lagenorhynchus obliquidens]
MAALPRAEERLLAADSHVLFPNGRPPIAGRAGRRRGRRAARRAVRSASVFEADSLSGRRSRRSRRRGKSKGRRKEREEEVSDKGGREGQLAVRTRFQAPQVRVSARPSRGAAARPVEPGRGHAGARGEDAGRGMQGLGAVPPPAPESEESAAHRCFSSLPVESGRQAARALPGSVGRNQGSRAAAVVAAWGQAPQCILSGIQWKRSRSWRWNNPTTSQPRMRSMTISGPFQPSNNQGELPESQAVSFQMPKATDGNPPNASVALKPLKSTTSLPRWFFKGKERNSNVKNSKQK